MATSATGPGLYAPGFEHDSCGFGLIACLDARPSHWLVETALSALARLSHRGAVGADGKTGDGCGVLIHRPGNFLRAIAAETDIALPHHQFAVGMVFLPQNADTAALTRDCLQRELKRCGIDTLGWRVVPTENSVCGEQALAAMPRIEQLFVAAEKPLPENEFERALFLARRRAEKDFPDTAYVVSLSNHTIGYKAMVFHP